MITAAPSLATRLADALARRDALARQCVPAQATREIEASIREAELAFLRAMAA